MEAKRTFSKHELRQMIAELIEPTIHIRRGSVYMYNGEVQPDGPPTDEEVDDFIISNILIDAEDVEQLTDPGLLGFLYGSATARKVRSTT